MTGAITEAMISLLRAQMQRSWLKRERTTFNSASLAITPHGTHPAGLMESRTHLLDITSEHAALALAVARKDPHVTKIITMIEGDFSLSPLVIKILADHMRRTGTRIGYTVIDTRGSMLFTTDDACSLFYAPPLAPLEKLSSWLPEANTLSLDAGRSLIEQLHQAAVLGLDTHFSSTTSSCYAAAVLAGKTIHHAGVYSSFDHRLNLHAEMVAALSAINTDDGEITDVALVSNKFTDEPVQMCGCCRQFFTEISQKRGTEIAVHCLSLDGAKRQSVLLKDYLPARWDSGRSLADRDQTDE